MMGQVRLVAALFCHFAGTGPRLVGCHRIEDVKEILVGLGLQVVRVYFEREASYLFITRSIDKSRRLLCILDILKSGATKYGFPLRRFRLLYLREASVEVQN